MARGRGRGGRTGRGRGRGAGRGGTLVHPPPAPTQTMNPASQSLTRTTTDTDDSDNGIVDDNELEDTPTWRMHQRREQLALATTRAPRTATYNYMRRLFAANTGDD